MRKKLKLETSWVNKQFSTSETEKNILVVWINFVLVEVDGVQLQGLN